jgi:hypothetical protein
MVAPDREKAISPDCPEIAKFSSTTPAIRPRMDDIAPIGVMAEDGIVPPEETTMRPGSQ